MLLGLHHLSSRCNSNYFGYVLSITLCCCALFTVTGQKPERWVSDIVALSPHLVEQLYSLGVGDRIVGTTDHADYPEGAKT